MKSGIKFIGLILVSIFLAWLMCFFTNKDGKYLYSDYLDEDLLLKGLNGAKAMCSDEEENIYIAIKNNIFSIDKNYNMKIEISEENSNIYDLEYYNGTLYYTTERKLLSYKLTNKEREVLVDGIPNTGLNKEDTMILLKEGKLYLTIGSNTNSGVVDSEEGTEDLLPVDTVLNGRNYDENRKGVFSPFNTKTFKGQVIKGEEIGNASVYEIDLSSGKKELYAHGIRNIKGMDYSNEGEIFAVIGGIEENGHRPLSNDCDYLYKIDKKTWYGWPDYSGGDPVNSPRFFEKDKSKINFVMDKHKSYIMPKPIYQNEVVESLNSLLVDRNGIIGEKDSFIMFDSKKNSMINLLKTGDKKEVVFFEEEAYIDDMKIIGNSLYLLDGEEGVLFRLVEKNNDFSNNINAYIILIFLNSIFIFSFILKLIISLKFNKR